MPHFVQVIFYQGNPTVRECDHPSFSRTSSGTLARRAQPRRSAETPCFLGGGGGGGGGGGAG